MIQATLPSQSIIVYRTHLAHQTVWVAGIFEAFVTAERTHLTDPVIVLPTDRRALVEKHHRGAVSAQWVYAVPEAMVLGEMDRYEVLRFLQTSPNHDQREVDIHQILESLSVIADNYVVTL